MDNLQYFTDYRPSTWLDRGVLFTTQAVSSAKRAVNAAVKSAIGIAAISAAVLPSTILLPESSTSLWPIAMQAQHQDEQRAQREAISRRINEKIAKFLIPDPTLSPVLLREARATLESVEKKRG